MDYSRPELADRLAADYAAGTLRGPARRRFEALLPAHPALRSAVLAWQQRLMPLTLAVEPQAPPARVWKKIEARLNGPAAVRPAAPRWWAQLVFWRGVSLFAGAAALTFAVLLGSPGPVQAPIVVVLAQATPGADGTSPASFVASVSADGRAMVTRPLMNVSVQATQSLELWSVPASGAPRSLGLISSSGTTVVQRHRVLDGAAALAVSLEPAGGSTTGAPSGPVLYVGKLTP